MSPEIAVAFLVESYKSVLERRSYVSFIDIIVLFVLPVCSFWHCKCRCSRASLWTVLRVVYDIVWFCSGKALNLAVFPMIVHAAPRCGKV